jgi:exocyst complex component 4
MEQVLISGSRQLRFVNEHGVKKIQRNVVALQQNLKTLTDVPRDTGLERAKQFYGLFSLEPSVSSYSRTICPREAHVNPARTC